MIDKVRFLISLPLIATGLVIVFSSMLQGLAATTGYAECLDKHRNTPFETTCGFDASFFDNTLIALAMLAIGSWLLISGTSRLQSLQTAVSGYAGAAVNISISLYFLFRGIQLYFEFLGCLDRCPSGICDAGPGPSYTCYFPMVEFVISGLLMFIGFLVLLIHTKNKSKSTVNSDIPE